MSCRFRGAFTSDEKERLEKTARSVERLLSREAGSRPAWAFLHFKVPYDGHPYWGVRLRDGLQVGADTVEELAASLKGIREDRLRTRERRQRRADRIEERP